MDVDPGDDWRDIGQRIREARVEVGISVRELGRRVNVSPSHISQVERGLGSFSVSALYAVASQLNISLDSLFEAPPSRPAESDPVPPSTLDGTLVQRAGDRPSIKLKSGPRWERLTVDSEPDVEFLEVIYDAVENGAEPEFSRHAGIEYGVVISGALNVQVGFDATILYPGDAIRLDSSLPHRYWNAGTTQVRAIWFEVRGERGSDAAQRVPSDAEDRSTR